MAEDERQSYEIDWRVATFEGSRGGYDAGAGTGRGSRLEPIRWARHEERKIIGRRLNW